MPFGRRGDAMKSRQRAVNEVASCGVGCALGTCNIRVVRREYLAEQNGRSLLATDATVQIIKCGDALVPHRGRMFGRRLYVDARKQFSRRGGLEICAFQPLAA